jgi:LmbE family N-acetylglucosaminyl deacetylase
VPRLRRAEQEKAAAVLGVGEVRFLGLPEGGLLSGAGTCTSAWSVRSVGCVRSGW